MISILRHKQRKILRFSLTIYDEYGTYQEDTRIPPFLPQKLHKLSNGAGTVADAILDVGTKLGKRLVVTTGHEDRIVAEALAATALADDVTLYDAIKIVRSTLVD